MNLDNLAEVSKLSIDNKMDEYASSLRALRGRARDRGTMAPSPEDLEAQNFLYAQGHRRFKENVPYRISRAGKKQYLAPYHNESGAVMILDDVPLDAVRPVLTEITGKADSELFHHVLQPTEVVELERRI